MNLLSAVWLNFLNGINITDPNVGPYPGQPLFDNIPLWLVYMIRTLVGGLLGLAIGFERSRRQKEAGIATHFVVGCAATLFSCLSLYFSYLGDGQRIAAQVVSGVGFLGAGMIFFRRESLRGLTTAAGIWATAAIAMCVAGGLYLLAVCATAAIIVFQVLLHSKLVKKNRHHLLLVKMEYSDELKRKMMEYFGIHNFHRFKVTTTNEKFVPDAKGKNEISDPETEEPTPSSIVVTKKLIAETVIYPTMHCKAEELAQFLIENPDVLSIERLEDL